jgi:hypothetical protein
MSASWDRMRFNPGIPFDRPGQPEIAVFYVKKNAGGMNEKMPCLCYHTVFYPYG